MEPLALIATRKGLFKLNADKSIEEVAFMGVPVSMILAAPQKQVWFAALDHGHFGVKLHRSTDAGKNWQEIASPTYPKSEDTETGDTLELVWSLEFAAPQDPDKLWAGTIPGGLFYSDDQGDSWTLNTSLWTLKQQHQWFGGGYDNPGIHSICVDPRNNQEIKVGISCGGVWVSRDAGKSWQNCAQGMRAEYMPPEKAMDPNIQDPHRVVQCLNQPDNFWSQHHNGIFRSTDNCQNWEEIKDVKPAVFGFATVVHPNDGNTAWFVPGVKDECRIPVKGKFVVTRTRDGGKNFEILDKGLPQTASYDLVFRHALAIHSDGNQLLMGSTTGNLWYSSNQGDLWEPLTHYLPPVNAVAFL